MSHHLTPEAKEQSKQWTERRKSAPKKVKTVPISGTCRQFIRDARAKIFIGYLQKRKITNDEYYANLLQRLTHEIERKRPHLAKKKVLFHRDNAPVHTSVIAVSNINRLKFRLHPHAFARFNPLELFAPFELDKWFVVEPAVDPVNLRSPTVLTLNMISRLGKLWSAKWKLRYFSNFLCFLC